MNISTFIGVFGFWTLLFWAMNLAAGVRYYFDLVSILIVAGGSVMIAFGAFNIKDLKKFPSYVKYAFTNHTLNSSEKARRISQYALDVKKSGKLSIEAAIEAEVCPFTKSVFRSFIDGMSVNDIEALYSAQIDAMEDRHKVVISIFDKISDSAGLMGLVGTLVGLVAMLLNMSDPSTIGPAMAIALLTTLYGAVLSSGFSAPISSKLSLRNSAEVLDLQISLNGALFIANGDNPRIVEQKLMSLLPPSERTSIFDANS